MELAKTTRTELADEGEDRDDAAGGAAEGALEARRQELFHRLTAARFASNHLERLVFRTGRAAGRLLRLSGPPSYWTSAAILTGLLLAIFGAETWIARGLGGDWLDLVPFRLAMLGALFAVLVVMRLCTLALVSATRDGLLDHVTSAAGLTDLERRLHPGPWKRVAVLGLLYGLTVEGLYGYFVYAEAYTSRAFVLPLHAVLVTACFGLAIYGVFVFWGWLGHLGGYRLRLFGPDPSSSEVIALLSGTIRRIVTLIAAGGAAVTLVFTLFGLANWVSVAPLVAVIWFPTLGAFATGHASLARLIATAKRAKLREIQGKVEALEASGGIEDRETMEAVKRLLEYHDRIRHTPGSAIDLRAGLNLVQSLLLPVAALVLANLQRILELLGLADRLGLGP